MQESNQITINLNDKEKLALSKLSEENGTTEEQIMRLALRVFQTIDYRIKNGSTIFPRDIAKDWSDNV